MGRCVHRMSAASAVLLTVCIAAAVAPITARAYDHEGVTVAGALMVGTNVEGPLGVSRLLNPFPICADFDLADASDATLLIGGASYFFMLDRHSTFLKFWFGQGSSLISGPIDKVRLTGVFGCVTLRPTSSSASPISVVYYVQNDPSLYWVVKGIVYLTQVGSGVSLFDVGIYNGDVYLLTSQNSIYKCAIGAGGAVTGSGCLQILLTGSDEYNRSSQRPTNFKGFTVSAAGIFIALSSDLYWFRLTGEFVAKTSGVRFVDAKYTDNGNAVKGGAPVLMAASTSAVYRITISGSSISYTLVAGTETPSCRLALDNVDSPTNPTFCGITRIYPLTADVVYMTLAAASVVRAILVGNTTVSDTIPRTPFPLNFVDNSSVMPLVLDSMNFELMGSTGLPFPFVAIDPSSPTVSSTTWDTNFSVDISNAFFTTEVGMAVTSTPFSGSLHGLETYYNRTNFILFGDANVMPICNLTKLLMIQLITADHARNALGYPFVYTSNATNFTVGTQPNLTLVKLLMPYPFGEILNESGFFKNVTTPAALATVPFDTVLLAAVRSTYTEDRLYDHVFDGREYPLGLLSAEQQQQARWLIYMLIMNQLEMCAQSGPHISSDTSSSDSHDDLVEGCVPRIGISNLTEMRLQGVSHSNFNITVFIPETMHVGFNISNCLNETDWSDLLDYLQKVKTSSRKCDTGCIVGIAVLCAVVAAALVVAVVIITSKRRRLATVVAPAAISEPKFASTLDMGSEDSSRNPLNG
ncbi:hypothetical protein LSCM1_07060 [Leishmania martiniquensis]|uniref:Membrane-associated protein n=1 Tax=Leishmania martiniquensis TaxID=1580590 RepID=A0A836H138_9TRYP|nr:hypothetical protein LSCM1_07060 [Leishmania martiniquensis]